MNLPFSFSVSAGATAHKDPFSTSDNTVFSSEITKARLEVVNFVTGGPDARITSFVISATKACTVGIGVRNVAGTGTNVILNIPACAIDGGGVVRNHVNLRLPLNLDGAATPEDDILIKIIGGASDTVVSGDLEFYK